MLKYFITVTEDLLTTSVLVGMLFACGLVVYGKRGRTFLAAGSVAGLLCAAVMSVLKNRTSLIHTGIWNVRIFTVSLIALAVYFIVSSGPLRRRLGKTGETVALSAMAVLAFTFLFYALPDVYAYPYKFNLGGASVFSTDFLYRLIGWLLGLILIILTCVAVERSSRQMEPRLSSLLLGLALLVNAVQQAAKIIQVLITRRILTGHNLFVFARYTSNYSDLFIYAILAVTLIVPVVMWIRSFHINEPYENPAQRRKIRAKWRSTRRWSAVVLVCSLLAVLNLTVLTAVANRTVELSPAEDCEVRDGNV